MVIRQEALMGDPGGVYVLCSFVACVCGILGVALQCEVLVWLALIALSISFLLGWIIDQARWWMPVVASPRDKLNQLTYREEKRVRIYCGLAFLFRCVAVGVCAAWLVHVLQVATTGRPF